jgi:hypothetical protein
MPENEQAQDDTQACQNEAPYSYFNFNNFSRSAIAGASSGGGLGPSQMTAAWRPEQSSPHYFVCLHNFPKVLPKSRHPSSVRVATIVAGPVLSLTSLPLTS